MHIATKKSTRKAWTGALAQPAKEFSPTPLPVISGKIPSRLRGTLYRNGPARLERAGIHMGHWFDGDGAILAVHFNDAGAKAVYRYVQTAGYKEEAAADKLLYGNYGMTAPGNFWDKITKATKNAANTSVLALPDKLLALWEGGKPHALDLEYLETRGEEDLSGLTGGLPYSAHPKRDGKTGEIFNFGITPGLNATLNVYKSTASGRIVQKAAHQIDGVPMLHDFVLAGQYLVFCIPPVRLNFFPVIAGLSSFSEAMEWQPKLGTKILVIDRQTLEVVSRSETEPWYQWHFSNSYVDGGSLIVDLVRYKDFTTNEYLKEIGTGEIHTPVVSTLWRVEINPQTGKIISNQQILDRHCEFPIVPQQQVGQNSPSTYLSIQRPEVDTSKEIFGAIARFEPKSDKLTIADCGENRYPSEPIYVQDSGNPEQAWILTVVYDGNSDSSEVWVFDSDRLNDEPVCKLELPSVIPHSFHGTWKTS
jgi:carotenoid cleavage dioxygenase-like enzyme